MSTIIIAWEYEKDYLQINYLRFLQSQLIAQGHQAILVGSNYPTNMDTTFPFIFAPRPPHLSLHKPRAITRIGGFSDRLALLGFQDANVLEILVTAWEHLFDLLKPDLLLADCAPAASLAACGRVPVICCGDGFGLPPSHLTDFPRLRPDAPPLVATQTLLDNVNLVQHRRGKPALQYLPELFKAERQYIYQFKEFDPYLPFRQAASTQYGPFFDLPANPISEKTHQFFAYLDVHYPEFEEAVIALLDTKCEGTFYIPGSSAPLHQYINLSGCKVVPDLTQLNDHIQNCGFILHHGSATLAEVALALAIPQFVLPQHFESDWLSHQLVQLGVGLAIYPSSQSLSSISEHIQHGRAQTTLQEWAVLRQQQLQQRDLSSINYKLLNAMTQHL